MQLYAKHISPHQNTVRHTATHCDTLRHTAIHFDTLQQSPLYTCTRSTPTQSHSFHAKTLRDTLRYTATHCNIPPLYICTQSTSTRSASFHTKTQRVHERSDQKISAARILTLIARSSADSFAATRHAPMAEFKRSNEWLLW